MNIGFDATAFLADSSRNRGIGNYCTAQFEKMIKDNPNDYFYCLNLYNEKMPLGWEKYDNYREIEFFSGKSIELLRFESFKPVLGKIIKEFLCKYKIDCFYFTYPMNLVNYVYDEQWFCEVATVATAYDLIPLIFPDLYFTSRSLQKKYLDHLKLYEWVDRIIAISENTKKDFVKYLNVDENKIDVVLAGLNKKKLDVSIGINETTVCKKYNLSDDYFLFVGGDDPRKNIERTIEGFAKALPSLKKNYQLVIVCKMSEQKVAKLDSYLKQLQIHENVVFTGYVSDNDLEYLLAACAAVLFPSLYEGFGLPIIEAWGCGTAVLTSDNSSLKEIAKDAAILVDAYSIDSISEGIKQLDDSNTIDYLRDKGRAQLGKYTWEKVSCKTMQSLRGLKRFPISTYKRSGYIAFFSPLPPIESGISDYSVDIIMELAKVYDIDIYIDCGYEATSVFPANVSVYPHYMFIDNVDKYDEIIYQVGNSRYHMYMYDYIQEFPGIVVLHDLNIHSSIYEEYGICAGSKFLKYREYALQDLSENEFNEFVKCRLMNMDSASLDATVLNGFVVNYAKKIIVHSNYAKAILQEKDAMREIAVIPLYSKIVRCINKNQSDTIIFGVHGIIAHHKRIVPIIYAFKKLLDDGYNVKLVLAGKYATSQMQKQVEMLLDTLGLNNAVRVTGFLNLDQFEKEIEEADVHINLRFPYGGENSGSLGRILGMGKCAIVSNIGSFAEIPDDACIKVKPANEVGVEAEIEELYDAMITSMSVERRERIEKNALLYAKSFLSISSIVASYMDVIDGRWNEPIDNAILRRYLKQIKCWDI